MSVLPMGCLSPGIPFTTPQNDALNKRIDALESNQKQFIKELKEYLVRNEDVTRMLVIRSRGAEVGLSRGWGALPYATWPLLFPWNEKMGPKWQAHEAQGLQDLHIIPLFSLPYSAETLFKENQKTSLVKQSEQSTFLEQRIAALEAEVAFLKNLPPSLMETLGYKKS